MISRFMFLAFGLLLTFSLPVQAQLFPSGGSNGDFLPVEEAFSPQAWIDGDRLMVGIEAADGYYLYRHRLSISTDSSEVTLGEPVLPAGTFKKDEFLGEVYVFHDRVTFPVPIKDPGDADSIDVTLHYQGCAEAGLCYPPQQVELTALPGSAPAAFAPPSSSPQEDTTESAETAPEASSLTSEDGQFSNLLQDASPALVLGLFFLAGLGLTFTPCVLPMMPILASIIVGQRPSRLRAFALSGSYVTGMALTYAGVGVLMGLFGAGLNLQARLQSPAVLIPFAALFVVFALAMFSVFQLRLPARLTQRLDAWQDRAQQSGPLGLALAGALSVLVVSPCVSAPLAGALVFISSTGNAAMGGLGLLALALGMGVPLLIVGTFGATLLPRSGAWMQHVKSAFGVLLLGVAIWLVERLLPGPLTLLLWGALAIGSALALGALRFDHPKGLARLGQAGGLMLLAWGLTLVVGAAGGAEDPLRPLAWQTNTAATNASQPAASPRFTTVTGLAGLNAELDRAARSGQPAFVDVSADWCISCKIMERDVFPDPQVAARLDDFYRIRVDVTESNAESRALLERFELFGPPSLLFFNAGKEIRDARIQGEVEAAPFADHLSALLEWFAKRDGPSGHSA
ncbi:thiol:disulfide interchange protein DsbD [Onishia taeanensis]|uniref:Thiol:disulfide interchange protein DsbD n=1 Tax=Onishia taeanensis TaxID=284577 RepID=A0A328Y659_9GAMM|nr:thiol:disulfide interchange protein DsbD [Halomonas taeanensis]